MKLFRARPEDVVGALLLPSPRAGAHDSLPADEREDERVPRPFSPPAAPASPRSSDASAAPSTPLPAIPLPREVERRLAHLAGVEALHVTPAAEGPDEAPDVRYHGRTEDYSHRLLRVAQLLAIGGLATVAAAAMLSARFGSGTLHVHPLPFALWGLGAALSAVAVATLGSDPTGSKQQSSSRRALGAVLIAILLTCVAGVDASAGGLAGPTWVLFFPIVLVCGAVLGPAGGLTVGAAAGAGIYTAAGVTHTLTVTGIGHLVVILPAAPAAGWAAGALARLARQAAADAAERRAQLERDVQQLADVLDAVAAGDLTRVPAPGDAADPVTTSLAVVFADTLLALRRLVRQMNAVTEQLASSAGQLATAAEQTVGGVKAQTSAVAETTSTVEQLAATAGSIADIAVRVARFAGSTRRDVEVGAEAVRASGAAMDQIAVTVDALAARAQSLRQRIAQVGDATRLIDDIARRTTILAVNASIEAARAGDHGRGFATVACEVDVLAGRAREATAQIGDILAELEQQAAATAVASSEGMAAVETGAELQLDVVDALNRITRMVDRTTAAAREITEATRQQRFASDAVVAAMTTVTTSSERYRDGSVGHAAAAKRMHDLAERLKDTLSRFRVA